MLALALLASAAIATPMQPDCDLPRVRAAVAWLDDAPEPAREVVTSSLDRTCVEVVDVPAGPQTSMLAAAREAGAETLVVARAELVGALQESRSGVLFHVDLAAFDPEEGARRGHAVRQASLLGSPESALDSREAHRVADDAARVLRKQLDRSAPRACATTRDIVVLWHKDTVDAGKAVVVRDLETRCLKVSDQIDGMRAEAVELARDLGKPLVAVKAVLATKSATPSLVVTVDRIDPVAAELRILAHARESLEITDTTDDAEVWRRARATVRTALDKGLGSDLGAAMPAG